MSAPPPLGLSRRQMALARQLAAHPPVDPAAAWEAVCLVAAAWARAKPHQRAALRTAALGIAGLVQRRRCRATGVEVGIYNAECGLFEASEGGADGDGRYAVICEPHGTLVIVSTLDLAREVATDTLNFCDDCREVAASAPARPTPAPTKETRP